MVEGSSLSRRFIKVATTPATANVHKSVAETLGMKPNGVKGAVEAAMGVASGALKKLGSFLLAGVEDEEEACNNLRKGVSKEMPVGWEQEAGVDKPPHAKCVCIRLRLEAKVFAFGVVTLWQGRWST